MPGVHGLDEGVTFFVGPAAPTFVFDLDRSRQHVAVGDDGVLVRPGLGPWGELDEERLNLRRPVVGIVNILPDVCRLRVEQFFDLHGLFVFGPGCERR